MRWLLSPWTLGVFGLVVLAILVLVRSRRTAGFRQLLRNPDARDDIEEHFADTQRNRQRAGRWSKERVCELARRFVFAPSDEARQHPMFCEEARVLEQHARSIEPLVVAWLAEPATLEELLTVERRSEYLLTSGLERACVLLGDSPTEAIVTPLAPLLDHAHEHIRSVAAFAIGKVGSLAAARALCRALADEKEDVRDAAANGLGWAVGEGRLQPAAAEVLFDPLLAGIGNTARAEELLLRCHRTRAVDALRERGHLAYGAKAFGNVVKAMAEASVLLPRSELLAVWEQILADPEDGWHKERSAAAVMNLLATHRDPADRPLFEGLLGTDRRLATAAAEALLRSHGIENLVEHVLKRAGGAGFEGLEPPDQHVLAVHWLNAEVCNGGFDQYFVNPTGNQWQIALAGLGAMQAQDHEATLRSCIARFGEEPKTSVQQRRRQLAEVSPGKESIFAEEDKRWFHADRPIEAFLTSYLLQQLDGR